MNTQDTRKASAAIFNAAASGKTIEWNSHEHGWVGCDPFENCSVYNVVRAPEFYRIKPEPVTRPWSKPEDVPGPVCWIRSNKDGAAFVIGINEVGVAYVGSYYGRREEVLLSRVEWGAFNGPRWQYSTDRKTWQPCVVTEAQP